MSRSVRATMRIGLLALFALAVVVAAGCGGGDSTTSGSGDGTGASAGEAKDGGVLKVALESEPSTLNPSEVIEGSSAGVVLQISEGLYEMGPEGEPVPRLAKSAKASKDGLTWTIQLQEGVKFSDGSPMTADDVVFTIDEARNSPYFAGLYEVITSAKASSPTTVVLKLEKPNPALLSQFGLYTAYVVPDDFGGISEQEFAKNPVGTGPYMLKSWKRGQGPRLVKNPNYWDASKPHLDEIVFVPITNESSRLAQIRGGELQAGKASALAIKTGVPEGSGVNVVASPQIAASYLLLSQKDDTFKDARIREAVNLAIDRDGIVKTATDEAGESGLGYLPPAVAYSIADQLKPPARDAEKAKELVAEAVADGVDDSFTIKFYSFEPPLASQIIQQNLEEVGLDVELQPLDEAALNGQLEAGEYEAVMGVYSAAITDPTELVGFYVGFFGAGAGVDTTKLAKLGEEAAVEMDSTKRGELYAQFQELIAEEEVMQVVYYNPLLLAVSDEVTGATLNAVGNLMLREAGYVE